MEFSGRLSAFPPGNILQWASHDRRTGALIVRRTGHEKRIYFKDGDVVACLSDDPAEFYGQHLLLTGHLNEATLVRALTYCTKHGKRLGLALVELGILAPAVIQETLRQQIEDAVCDLFLWDHGVFFFEAEMPPEEQLLPEPIHTVGLVMEGTRWVDEMARIRKVFPHDNVVLRRAKQWWAEDLTPVQKRILAAADGKRPLDQLYRTTRGSHFRFLEGAFGLCVRGALDIESVGEATAAPAADATAYDDLLERMTEEQVLARRSMAIPFDVWERLFPVWVGEPSPADWHSMADLLRDLYADCDGRAPLGKILAAEAGPRERQIDLFLKTLREGRIALLPASIEGLEAAAEQRGDSALKRWWRRLFPPPAAE